MPNDTPSVPETYRLPQMESSTLVQVLNLKPPSYNLPLIRLSPPSTANTHVVKFVIPAGDQVLESAILATNYPLKGSSFERSKFNQLKFDYDFVNDGHCTITFSQPGAYEYYVVSNYETSTPNRHPSGYIIVEPRLTIPDRSNLSTRTDLPLDGISLQTFVPKWLGPINQWMNHFQVAADLGYNMVHFVPLQKRGVSNSPYSIYDQLDFADDLFEKELSKDQKIAKVKWVVGEMEKTGILSMTDVVWNHTACNCEWLQEHPEAGYNLINSPHLRPAYELDEGLLEFSKSLKSRGLPTILKSEKDLNSILATLQSKILPQLKLWEYFVVNVLDAKESMKKELEKRGINSEEGLEAVIKKLNNPLKGLEEKIYASSLEEKAKILSKHGLSSTGEGFRYHMKINDDIALAYLLSWFSIYRRDCLPSALNSVHIQNASNLSSPAGFKKEQKSSVDIILEEYVRVLNEVNLPFYKKYDSDVMTILENLKNTMKWQRLAENGPKLGEITADTPLVWSYFTRIPIPEGTTQSREAYIVANNGWIWNANPMVDFASNGSQAYFRREVIVWGDCVKLRYGKNRDDNPWLWDHMASYTKLMASLFHGFRIDNCHSTPIHVAQYLLDLARKERPDLYVIAELFTGDERTDEVFVSKLGINSLIREAMQAWDTKELSRLIHRYSGDPVGSFKSAVFAPNPSIMTLKPSAPHAIFMDCTHDNETPAQKRTAQDALPNAALVAFSCCAMGSVKGYDELVPKYLDIVNEKRVYIGSESGKGLGPVRKKLNELHSSMAVGGYSEIYVHQENQYIVVYRQHPVTHKGYVLVARTAFQGSSTESSISPIILRNTNAKLILASSLSVQDPSVFHSSSTHIDGLSSSVIDYLSPSSTKTSPLPLSSFYTLHKDEETDATVITLSPQTPKGIVMIFETELESIDNLGILHDLESANGVLNSGIYDVLKGIKLEEINVILYRVNGEEKDFDPALGTYNIPGYGDLVYCGLEGFVTVLKPIIRNNDLGHPFCGNLREGFWMLDYIVNRLDRYGKFYPSLIPLANWLRRRFDLVKTVPNYLVPEYFAVVLMITYNAVKSYAISLMSPFVRNAGSFMHSLAMCSLQMHGLVNSASLYPLQKVPSLAAGLPHFSNAHMRCWGRDVFISLKGLFLSTGQFSAAREHILAFGSTLRHGLIPNLLDGGTKPRYNARDAVWFFLNALQEYVSVSPEGVDFLKAKLKRRFPLTDEYTDLTDPRTYSTEVSIEELIQEILQRHADGIQFREWNAGLNLDHAMSDNGFNVEAKIDWSTGFVQGGNPWNCGTWMDKMGDSEKAGTKGVPATPRDGSAIELVGLCKSAVRWVTELNEKGLYRWDGVHIKDASGSSRKITFREWDNLIKQNFEKHFYIPVDKAEDSKYVLQSTLINRRGIYKDSYKSTKGFTDYQFRPNIFVAMVVAPELFEPQHALNTIRLAKQVLLGPMGMKTLDPADWGYRGNYHNGNDTSDPTVAKGFNYHQGPEWVWCVGYFLRALLYFESRYGNEDGKMTKEEKIKMTLHSINRYLSQHRAHIAESVYAGIPELTNADGEVCWDSCPTQAWSAATLLELGKDMAECV
ncbi:glucanotransferase domain of glycogen debranching enzyme-domain-containing protein [Paraphysoderma sedebokerense]|nr:glucanotransferase domain of glycogen debranching enzyme-domain-containing protein [Paraphysoderma sedebokerense]